VATLALLRWIRGLLFLPLQSFGGAAGPDSRPGAAWSYGERGTGAAGFIASAGTMAYAVGKFVSGSLADLFGDGETFWADGGLDSVHAAVCAERRVSAVHAGLVGNRLFQSTGWWVW